MKYAHYFCYKRFKGFAINIIEDRRFSEKSNTFAKKHTILAIDVIIDHYEFEKSS